MKLTVIRTETLVKQRKKEKQNMAINLSDIREAVLDYFSSQVVASITVAALNGREINPDEQFAITLTAKNSAGNSSQGVQINNVCYHVSVDDDDNARLIAPPTSVAVTRENASSSSSRVNPGEERQELFLFHDVTLQAGDTDSVSIFGHAVHGGATKLKFHMHGDVDLNYLFPPDQQSATSSQSVSIVT
jgi:hypothetical protein